MSLSLYNTLTRKTEVFTPIHKEFVGLYACGPTVYWFAHIGNMRANVFADLLHRTLRLNGYQVKFVMNITDVGHLTSDEDEGEDKMIVAMKREGKTAYEIAEFYTNVFFEDLAKLNVMPADVYPRATAHIEEQISMLQAMERNGFTYVTSDGVYFDTSKLPEYGVLSGQRAEEKLAGARVEMKEKRHATDFALWKFAPEGVQREMQWKSPWGVGFPGWHIECTAMSTKYLGHPFDIHTGGVDHIAVHHENELAQAVGCCGAYHARFWMHSEFLTVDNGKMSKSLGNVYTVADLVERGFDPLAYRYFVLGAHYRTKLNFTWEALEAAQNALHRLFDEVREWEEPSTVDAVFLARFTDAMNNDLATAQALAVLWELVEDKSLPMSVKSATLLKFDEVLGLSIGKYVNQPIEIPEEVRALLRERDHAREEKNWSESDRLRAEIELAGFVVEDSVDGSKLKLKWR